MNSADLVINESSLVHSKQGVVSIKDCRYNVQEETYIIDFEQSLTPGLIPLFKHYEIFKKL